jgi:hypothetical protein
MWGSPEETATITVNEIPVTVRKNLAAALDCLRSNPMGKIWVDALCINQDDVDERNAYVMRIREIYNQSHSVTAWLGEDEMSKMDLNSWVENSFDNLRRCGTILEAHGRPTLEAALGIDVRAWESDNNYDELEDFPFSSDVLYFDNEWWADSDDEEEFGPPHFRDLVALALQHLVQNPYWTRLWIIQELAVSPTSSMLDWGNSSVSLQTVLTLADIFCNKVLDRGTLSSHMVNAISPCLHLLNSIGQWQRSGVLSNREDGLKGTALDDLCRLARSAQCTLAHDKVFGLLGLLPQAMSSKIMIDYKRDETDLSSEFTAAVSIANENSENLMGAGDVITQSMTGNPLYALQDIPGKGKGLVAIEKIFKGTRILSEEPIITIPRNELNSERVRTTICQQVDALSEHQRQGFLSMHNIYPYENTAEQYLGILQTNTLPIDTDESGGGIFLEACRINHACDNNAQKSWNENTTRHTVHALRDIDKGEEITITYIRALRNRKSRREALHAKFDFECLCPLCSLPLEQSQESDRRLEEIYRLDGVIDQLGTEGVLLSPLRTLRYFDQQVLLYNKQGREDVGLAQVFVNAAQIAIANSDLARGRIFAERAVSVWRTALGGDSTHAIEHGNIARDPSKYRLYGVSKKWRTTEDETPRGLESSDFEDWLWRREKPKALGQLANLRSRSTFPGFIDLPDENDVDPEFYESSHTGRYRPRRHWCFLQRYAKLALKSIFYRASKIVWGNRVAHEPLLLNRELHRNHNS